MKILLIEDSALSRSMLKKALGEKYTLLEATDGISGLETYFLEKPDLVILDLTMPGMNGIDVLQKIHEMDAGARVIVGTADVQVITRQIVEDIGVAGFIPKPFELETVQRVVDQVLAREE